MLLPLLVPDPPPLLGREPPPAFGGEPLGVGDRVPAPEPFEAPPELLEPVRPTPDVLLVPPPRLTGVRL
ncbi:MAG: hypothetical protein ACXVVQ_02585 [Solirubrobacteraceae bacterium]